MAPGIRRIVQSKVGAVIHAFNSEICYTDIAVECARRVKMYLNIPVCLITNEPIQNEYIDVVKIIQPGDFNNTKYWHDRQTNTKWYNHTRRLSFDLSPWDRTLLLDADYLIGSDTLMPFLSNQNQPLYAFQDVISVAHSDFKKQFFGSKSIPMWWATVVIFDRSDFVKDVFTIWKMVQNNYKHYADLFGFAESQFRNDYAFSIALLAANGNCFANKCNLPYKLVNVDPENQIEFIGDAVQVNYNVVDKQSLQAKKITLKNQDVHVMCKMYLENRHAAV